MNIIPAHYNTSNENSQPDTIWAYTVTVSEHDGEFILYNWLNSEYAVVDDEAHPVYCYLSGLITSDEMFTLLTPEENEFFVSRKFLSGSSAVITEQIKTEYSQRKALRPLHLILLPAEEACNFGCLYCYENPSKKRKMTAQHSAVLTGFVKSYGAGSVHLEYFGGEPLLNPGFILEFNTAVTSYCNSANIPFSSGITTNGYLLTPELFKQLFASGLDKYQITLDGNEEDHNFTRPLRGGGATYSTILANLKAIKELPASYNYTVHFRVNFNENTATPEKRTRFIALMKETFGDDKRFNIRFRPIGDYSAYNNKDNAGDVNCSHNYTGSIKEEYETLAHSNGIALADTSLYCGTGTMQCYAGDPGSFIIAPDYSVYKCTIAFDDPVNLVGAITPAGRFEANENYPKWITPQPEKPGCGSCFLSGLCGGRACPLESIRKQQSVCPPLKDNYAHTVKMLVEEDGLIEEAGNNQE